MSKGKQTKTKLKGREKKGTKRNNGMSEEQKSMKEKKNEAEQRETFNLLWTPLIPNELKTAINT